MRLIWHSYAVDMANLCSRYAVDYRDIRHEYAVHQGVIWIVHERNMGWVGGLGGTGLLLVCPRSCALGSSYFGVSNLIFLSPVLSLIFISVILNEAIQLATLIGLTLIIPGIYLQNREGQPK